MERTYVTYNIKNPLDWIFIIIAFLCGKLMDDDGKTINIHYLLRD